MSVEPRSDNDSKGNYLVLKQKLEKVLLQVKRMEDMRLAKAALIEVQQDFKGIKLLWEDREELYGKLQDAFAEVNRNIQLERQQFEDEASLNYFNLKKKVEEALFMAQNPKDTRETWNFLLEVQAMFKGIKLLKEHREALYEKLQSAFQKVKELQNVEKTAFENEAVLNYPEVRKLVDEAVGHVQHSTDLREAKDRLIHARAHLRDATLTRDQKDELFYVLDKAFDVINERMAIEKVQYEIEAEMNFQKLHELLNELRYQSEHSMDFHAVREELKKVQMKIREASLLREQREELRDLLQKAFDILNERQDADRNTFLKEASGNYKQLNSLISKALIQVRESDKFRETREFLKSIQAEFKGIKLIKEEREELYAKLQSAFQILNERVDDYFRTKQKNWEVRMQFKVSEMFTEIELLKESVVKNQDELAALETQLDIVNVSGKDLPAVGSLTVRINSLRQTIRNKNAEIDHLEREMNDLKNRIEPEEDI
jgi:hypothetical protein